jgi:hypothetical protein
MYNDLKSRIPFKNYYRTKKYIVEQSLYFNILPNGNAGIFSLDKYTLRTFARDRKFEKEFKSRENVNGNRVYASIYKRKYQ